MLLQSPPLESMPEPTVFTQEFEGAPIKFIDLPAQTIETEANPIVLSSGWGISLDRSLPIASIFAREGHRTVVVDTSALIANRQDLKADAIYDVIQKLGMVDVDLVGYSEGALNATEFAAKHPELIHSLILFNPLGVINAEASEQGYAKINARFQRLGQSVIRGQTANKSSYLESTLLDRQGSVPLEAESMARANIGKTLGTLANNGMAIGIIQSSKDTYAPPFDTLESIKSAPITRTILPDPNALHSSFSTNPELSADTVLGVITEAAGKS